MDIDEDHSLLEDRALHASIVGTVRRSEWSQWCNESLWVTAVLHKIIVAIFRFPTTQHTNFCLRLYFTAQEHWPQHLIGFKRYRKFFDHSIISTNGDGLMTSVIGRYTYFILIESPMRQTLLKRSTVERFVK